MRREDPLISVIMNCHNGDKYLKQSIESVLNQTYKNIELIFFDNQSSDNSRKIVKSYQDSRIKYYKSDKVLKLYEARNLAIKHASGNFIAFLDTDDFWLPTKLKKQILLFSNNKDLKMVYSNCFILKEKKQSIFTKHNLPNGNITQQLLNHYQIPILTVLIKKNIFDEKLFNNNYEIIGDFDFFLKLSLKNFINSINEPLAYYRIHDLNTSLKKIHIQVSELEEWVLLNKNKDSFKNYSFDGVKYTIQSLKIKKNFLDGKKIMALKEIIKKPFNIKKLKFLFLIFIPFKKISSFIK